MVLIIFHHFAVHGQENLFPMECDALSKFWLIFIGVGGKIGVNIFVLISGYFLIQDCHAVFSTKKVIRLVGEMFFYSAAIYFAFCIWGEGEPFTVASFRSVMRGIFPFKWWFATTYLVLYIFHPYINILLKGLSVKQYQQMLLLSFFFFCLTPSIFYRFSSGDLIWFIFLYAIAGFIRLYGEILSWNKTSGWKMLLVGIGLYGLLAIFEAGSIKILGKALYFWSQDNLLVFLISIIVFLASIKIKIPESRWIKLLASATFGIYLLHDHPTVCEFLWKKYFETPLFFNLNLIIPYSIGVVLYVYLVGTAIDLLRIYWVERPFMWAFDRYARWGNDMLHKMYYSIEQRLFLR